MQLEVLGESPVETMRRRFEDCLDVGPVFDFTPFGLRSMTHVEDELEEGEVTSLDVAAHQMGLGLILEQP